MGLIKEIQKQYLDSSLEVRKKVRIFVWILTFLTAALFVITIVLFFTGNDIHRLVPYIVGLLFCIGILLLLFLKKYDIAVLLFICFLFPITFSVTIFDPYNTAFELYRLTLMLVMMYTIIGSISLKLKNLILCNILGNIFIISLFVTKGIMLKAEW